MNINMEKCKEPKAAITQMSSTEKAAFDRMMQEMQTRMNVVRMESVRMSREAERASAMAFLNC